MYSGADVERLYRICLLRRVGLPLADVNAALDDPAWDLRSTMTTHLHDLERRLETESRLRVRLTHLLAHTNTTTPNPLTDELLNLMEEMTMLDNPVRKRISILVYQNIDSAFEYLTRVFALGPGEVTRDGDGNAVHAELEAGDGLVWLHPESTEFGLSSPATLGAATAMMAVIVDDVDAHHHHAAEQGAIVVYTPIDQPYGYREYSARDSEGGLWSFMKPLTNP